MMESEEQNRDSIKDRRSFFRKLVAVAAVAGISGSLLAKVAEPVSANNIIPASGQATFDGPVGIATTSPETLLHVSGPATADVFCGLGPHPNTLVSGSYVGPAMNYGYSGNSFGRGSGFFNVRPDPSATAPNPSLRFMTNNLVAMTIDNVQRVGIGTSTPAYRFGVYGSNPTMYVEEASTSNSNLTFRRKGSNYWDFTENYGNYSGTTDNLGLYDYSYVGSILQIIPGGDTTGGMVNIGSPLPPLSAYPTALNVQSTSANANGVSSVVTSTTGIPWAFYGQAPSNGLAFMGAGGGYFSGLLTKAGGGFQIDHPVDPANKILTHSFVESPDMMNIYNGIATLDGNGNATVQLPDYFDALNQDFRYQLTAIGGSMPNLYIAAQVSGNQFQISGGTANGQVSWAVTGIRQDSWANANRIVAEQSKGAKAGFYIHPELYGQPESQSYFKPPTPKASVTTPSTPPNGQPPA